MLHSRVLRDFLTRSVNEREMGLRNFFVRVRVRVEREGVYFNDLYSILIGRFILLGDVLRKGTSCLGQGFLNTTECCPTVLELLYRETGDALVLLLQNIQLN